MDNKEKDKTFNPKVCYNLDDCRRFEEESVESAETIVVSEKWYKKHKKAVEQYKRQMSGGMGLTFASGEQVHYLSVKSTMSLDEFWEQNRMSNHTWGVTIGGR